MAYDDSLIMHSFLHGPTIHLWRSPAQIEVARTQNQNSFARLCNPFANSLLLQSQMQDLLFVHAVAYLLFWVQRAKR
jgi:hypothetical protein